MSNSEKKPTIISISSQLSRDLGTREEYTVPIPIFEDPEITFLPGQEITFESYRIQDGLSLIALPGTIKAKAQCIVTFKEFILEYPIAQIEKQCYLNIPEGVNPEDVALIDRKFYQIDTEELIREAVFLELPMIIKSPEAESQATKTTKTNPNSENEGQSMQNPFAGLKDMLGE